MSTALSLLNLHSFLRVMLSVSGAVVFIAMTGALYADEIPCAELMSTAELRSASEIAFEPTERKPANLDIDHESHSSCSWEAGEGGEKTITIDFWDLEAIRRDPYGGGTVSGFFDMFVASRQIVSDAKPQTLDGIGLRAVLFAEAFFSGERLVVLVELPHGMAYLRAAGLSREHVQAIAGVAGALNRQKGRKQ